MRSVFGKVLMCNLHLNQNPFFCQKALFSVISKPRDFGLLKEPNLKLNIGVQAAHYHTSMNTSNENYGNQFGI